jgi:hypothetical protein
MKTHQIARLLICLYLSGFCAPAGNTQVKECTDAEQREVIATSSRDWKAFYGVFRRLAHCDDGAMAESFSDNVVRLLAKDWKHFGDLESFVASNGDFRRFVLNHVDATTDPKDLTMIINNSRQHCPATAKRLCRSIEAEARSALKEQSAPLN